jgi:hypothetical protein
MVGKWTLKHSSSNTVAIRYAKSSSYLSSLLLTTILEILRGLRMNYQSSKALHTPIDSTKKGAFIFVDKSVENLKYT